MKKTKRASAERAQRIAEHAGTGHTCDQCARGHWNEYNRNYEGKRFLIYCKHGQKGYSPTNKSSVTYADCEACAWFVEGEKGGDQ